MRPQVTIDCFPESAQRYTEGYGIVAIDVIRATTTAITAVALGYRTFCAGSRDELSVLSAGLHQPIIAGELGGDLPEGFEMNNSPAELLERTDFHRPLVLLSSSGTRLVRNASTCTAAYLACFRNFTATAQYVASRHTKIALIGAGSRDEFREEDQICCAWIADYLLQTGFVPENGLTLEVIERWSKAMPAACMVSKSVDFLRRTGQTRDLDFILQHIDDLDAVFTAQKSEIKMHSVSSAAAATLADVQLAA